RRRGARETRGRRPPDSFSVHLGDEPPERAGLLAGQGPELSSEPPLAHRADLIHRDLGTLTAYPAAQAGAPGGMEPRGERADRDRLQSLVERIEAHDHRRPRLGHLRALHGIEISP